MKLYHHPFSPNCVIVRTVANLLGQPLELHYVDLMTGAQKSPEYLKLNPNGKVPTLVDGGNSIWETCAIIQYLASKKTNDLWPTNEAARLEITKWLFWAQCHFIRAISTYTFENVFKKLRGLGAPNPEALKSADEDFHRFAKVLDDQLAGHAYVTGDKLTLADIMAVAYIIVYAKQAGVPVSGYKNILRLADTVAALPAWQNAVSDTNEAWKKVA